MGEVLQVSKSVSLDANGRGLDSMGPAMRGEVWHIDRLSTFGESADNPRLDIYRGSESPQNLIDTSITGNRDISPQEGAPIILNDGEYITFVYTAGTTGAVMALRAEGSIERRFGRSYGV